MDFSACWIAKNEAENIKASIMSVKDCCDELIVVDTGSTDDTVQIARDCDARVEHFEWINDFSAAKNYALSLASGKIVILLDADEYFNTPLTHEDKENFFSVFEDSSVDGLQLIRVETDKDDGTFIGHTTVQRVFRRTAIHFENKIHEVPKTRGGGVPNDILITDCPLMHTGYSKSIIASKVKRNIEILEAEQQSLTDPFKQFLNAQYLLREHIALEQYDKAAEYCRYLLRHHKHWKAASKLYNTGLLQRYFHVMSVAATCRERFSERELHDKILRGIVRQYPGTREAALAELYFQYLFHYREDGYIRELEALERRLEKAPVPLISECFQVEATVFFQGAEAAHLRGDTEKSKRWAQHTLRYVTAPGERLLQLAGKDAKPYSHSSDNTFLFAGTGVVGALRKDFIEVFRANAERLYLQMRYADILNSPTAEVAASYDIDCASYFAYALTVLGEYGRAFDCILPHLEAGALDYDLLRLLLVISEKAGGELADEARKLYEESEAILNEGTRLSEIINTGKVYKAKPAKQKNAMREMTMDAFNALYEADIKRPMIEALLDAHKRAAPILEQNGCVRQAADSYRLLLARGRDPERNARHLERLFRECGNEKLADIAAITRAG